MTTLIHAHSKTDYGESPHTGHVIPVSLSNARYTFQYVITAGWIGGTSWLRQHLADKYPHAVIVAQEASPFLLIVSPTSLDCDALTTTLAAACEEFAHEPAVFVVGVPQPRIVQCCALLAHGHNGTELAAHAASLVQARDHALQQSEGFWRLHPGLMAAWCREHPDVSPNLAYLADD